MNRNIIKIKICPSCNREITGHPAISRRDNKTKICAPCGTIEAIIDSAQARQQPQI